MKVDWVPSSAAALVAGSIALSMGSVLTPTVADLSESLRIVQQQDGRWLAVAALYFGAAVAMTLGAPSILTLLEPRGARIGLIGTGTFVLGCIGTAGYATLLVSFRALVLSGAIDEADVEALTQDPGLSTFIALWITAFSVGEVFIAWAVLVSRSVAPWIPAMLLLHVASLPLWAMLDAPKPAAAAVLLVTVGLSGLGIAASSQTRST